MVIFMTITSKYIFGPVPSRRLGRSLGINNIPYKHCTYACVYCQIGKTPYMTIERETYYPWNDIVNEVIRGVKNFGEDNIDYITFVPDGEPTLDINIGKEIISIKENTLIKVAVITNGSLLFREDVRNDLYHADTVSIKVDAITESVFKRINRPHPKLELSRILEGIVRFARNFRGKLLVESMFVHGLNDNEEEIENIANFIAKLKPYKAYIAIPTRPPAEKWVKPADERAILIAYNKFTNLLGERVELLTGYEGPSFESVSDDPVQGFLAIISVHPMRLDYAYDFLSKSGVDPEKTIKSLLENKKIIKISYMGYDFVLHKIK